MITLDEAEAVETGASAIENRDESRFFQSLDSLTGIAIDCLSKNEETDAQRVILSIEDLAQKAAEKEMELVTINSILALGKLAKIAAEKGEESSLRKVYVATGRLGITAAANSLEAGSKIAATTLMEIWKLSSQQQSKEKTIICSLLLKEIGVSAAKQGVEEVVLSTVTGLGEIGKKAVGNSELETLSTLLMLEEIGKFAAEKYLDEALSSTALSVEEIGKLSIKKGLNDSVLKGQIILETFRTQAEEQLMTSSAVVAEMAFDSLSGTGLMDSEEKREKLKEIRDLHQKIRSEIIK
jgi:hypothetical protein